MDDIKGGGIIYLYRWGIDAVVFRLIGEAHVQSSVGLSVWGVSWVGEAIQELVCRNLLLCLGNQLFPKLVHIFLGIVSISYSVSVHLEDIDPREGIILESRVDQKGGVEV